MTLDALVPTASAPTAQEAQSRPSDSPDTNFDAVLGQQAADEDGSSEGGELDDGIDSASASPDSEVSTLDAQLQGVAAMLPPGETSAALSSPMTSNPALATADAPVPTSARPATTGMLATTAAPLLSAMVPASPASSATLPAIALAGTPALGTALPPDGLLTTPAEATPTLATQHLLVRDLMTQSTHSPLTPTPRDSDLGPRGLRMEAAATASPARGTSAPAVVWRASADPAMRDVLRAQELLDPKAKPAAATLTADPAASLGTSVDPASIDPLVSVEAQSSPEALAEPKMAERPTLKTSDAPLPEGRVKLEVPRTVRVTIDAELTVEVTTDDDAVDVILDGSDDRIRELSDARSELEQELGDTGYDLREFGARTGDGQASGEAADAAEAIEETEQTATQPIATHKGHVVNVVA